MKKICKYLIDEIQFVDNRIVPCGSRYWDGLNKAGRYFLKTDEKTRTVCFDLYFRRRNKYIKMYEDGEIPEFCQNCCIYQPIDDDFKFDRYMDDNNSYKFKKIHIDHKTICSCRCIYCCLADNGNLEKFKQINKQKTYDIVPILNQIEEKNLIDENTQLCLMGGECTEYPDELARILEVGIRHSCSYLILSNGIIYNDNIGKLLTTGKVQLRFSLDSGTKKTFEKVKRVKAFDRVISNIKQYSQMAKDNKNARIQAKYIICPGINDNINEIKSFLALAQDCGVGEAFLSINRFWLMKNSQKKIKSSIKQVIKYWHNKEDDEYPKVLRAVDNDELWDWWIQKALNEKTLLEKILKRG